MKPAVVFPFDDPDGLMYPHLETITPVLKQVFSETFLSITPPTASAFPVHVERLDSDSFFDLLFLENDLPVGSHFKSLYQYAARSCSPETVLHLCFIDRLAFVLQTNHRPQFVEDVRALDPQSTPTIFQRSPKAWATHPRNYWEIESFITRTGELILDRSLDFAWCHVAFRAGDLATILPDVRHDDLSMVAELILLANHVTTQDVDWLAWEDPFFSSCNAAELKEIRENSRQETEKRLSYAMPMVQRILEYGHNS